jgi:hypothetical protein
MGQPPQPQQFQLVMPPDMLAGVWANFAGVRQSLHEFTLDFVRADYDDTGKPIQGVLVARVNMSPLFVSQLIDALNMEWQKYTAKAMPKEVTDGEQED